MRRALARMAASAPPRVFVIAGRGGAEAAAALRCDPRLVFVDSPRSADVLLAVGGATSRLLRPAWAVHDQMAHPRATVWWTRGADSRRLAAIFQPMEVIDGAAADPVATVLRVHRGLQLGQRASEPDVLSDREPAEWRGVGPYGQGGKGMTGGVPYGRPMAERAPDRDGLELDQLPVRVGPFFAPMPAGLVLDVLLQGDVLQQVQVAANPFRRGAGRGRQELRREGEDPFLAVQARRVEVAELELARARHLLRWIGSVLHLHGLEGWARRGFRLAATLDSAAGRDAHDVSRFLARLDGRRLPGPTLRWAMHGLGVLEPTAVSGRGLGPVTRACGVDEDARSGIDAYRALGFEPHTTEGGDVWARFRQRVAEVRRALELALRAGDATLGPLADIEGPRGRLAPDATPASRTLLGLLPGLLEGTEWGDAMTIVASLDLDLEEAAAEYHRGAS